MYLEKSRLVSEADNRWRHSLEAQEMAIRVTPWCYTALFVMARLRTEPQTKASGDES